MNLFKKNIIGLEVIDSKIWKGLLDGIKGRAKSRDEKKESFLTAKKITLSSDFLDFKNPKTIRVSESIYEMSKKIDIDTIYNNIHTIDLKGDHLAILMPDDIKGVCFIKKTGSDIVFFHFFNLSTATFNDNTFEATFNVFNFFSKEFLIDEGDAKFADKERGEFVLKILVYLFYGDVTTKFCAPKSTVKGNNFMYEFKNTSKNNIWIADALWKTRISTAGFTVRGHFRLQPIGVGRTGSKLIFIEEFDKDGYNRAATIENFNTDHHGK